jgi:tRNA 2-thiouridine synthesizing protein A
MSVFGVGNWPATNRGNQMGNTIDLRGICCPTNFVKAKLALEMIKGGEKVEFLLDDGEPVKNVPRALKDEGHRLTNLKEKDGFYTLTLEKVEQ